MIENDDTIIDRTAIQYKEYSSVIPIWVGGDYAIGVDDSNIYYSSTLGKTWSSGLAINDPLECQFAFRFQNGTIIYFTRDNKAWKSTNNLFSSEEITLKDESGSDFTPHVPQDADYPGRYFWTLSMPESNIIDGDEVLVWGNYANVRGGAAPVIVWSCIDGGDVKIAYMFGQNPSETDNGTEYGGSGGTALGDVDNVLITRHIHDIAYHSTTEKWYMVTGDRAITETCGWFEISFDGSSFSVVKTISWNDEDRFKTGGLCQSGTDILIASDDTSVTADLGLFKAPIATYSNKATHTLIYDRDETFLGIRKDGDDIIALNGFGLYTSNDNGVTWERTSIANQYQLGGVNSDGYRLCQRITQAYTMIRSSALLVKIK